VDVGCAGSSSTVFESNRSHGLCVDFPSLDTFLIFISKTFKKIKCMLIKKAVITTFLNFLNDPQK